MNTTAAQAWPEEAVSRLLSACGRSAYRRRTRLAGGANNRVFRLDTDRGPVLVKWYFQHPDDPRDRLAAEFAFLEYARDTAGLLCVPEPLACDTTHGVALYEFIEGQSVSADELSRDDVTAALRFLRGLNAGREWESAAGLPNAAEACFSLREHLDCVEARIDRLCRLPAGTPLEREAVRFVVSDLRPLWEAVRCSVESAAAKVGDDLDALLPAGDRCLSPSDFGFHNALRRTTGELVFIDFEYAGWDDPAKLVCDWFRQVKVPVSMEYWDTVVESAAALVADEASFRQRVRLLWPVYGLKWCTILLNEFDPAGRARRGFGRQVEIRPDDQQRQLDRAAALLVDVHRELTETR